MKNLLILSILFIGLLSCNNSESEEASNKIEFKVDKRSYSGQIVEFYKNGARKFLVNYDDGVKNGKYETWFKSGTKKVEGEYKNGKRIGKWNWFNEQGKEYFAIEYDDVQLTSL